MKRLLALLLPAALLAPPALAADRYSMPPPGYQPDMTSDEAGLWMQVDKAEDVIKTSPALVNDAALNAYVQKLVCKLAGDYCASIRVYIVEVPDFNAAMMPNGAMTVQTGLLLRAENEAQLAFVLGHEITHYMERHTLQRMRNAVNMTGFLAVFSVATAGAGVGLLGGVATVAGVGSVYANSRDQERAADQGGFERATANGYDPDQAPQIWRYMAAEDDANPHHDHMMFLSTHPAPQERLATMEKKAQDIRDSRKDWVKNSDDFHAVMAPFVAHWVDDELARGRAEESVVMFRRLAANVPGEGLYQFALGESYRKRKQKNDAEAAENAYRGALACADAPAGAWRGLAMLAMERGDKAAAKDDFTQYRAKAPDASDKAMIDYYLTQL